MMKRQTLHKKIVGIQGLESCNAFQYFEERLSHVLETHLYGSPSVDLLRFKEKQMIFSLIWCINSPQRAPENTISDSELKDFGEKYQQIIRTFKVSHEGKEISLLDYNILAAFLHVLYHGIKNRKRTGHLKEAFAIPILEGVSMLKGVPNMYTACLFMLISRLNDIRKHCYSFEMQRSNGQGNLSKILTPVISLNWARQESMMIHRTLQSVYKVVNPLISSSANWLNIPKEKLGSHYSGNKNELNLYIQSDALTRLQECLDIFDQQGLNEILSFNLRHFDAFQQYKGNLLLPINLYQINVGYLVCDLIDDKLVVRTFRFITHNNTPEGDCLINKQTQSSSEMTFSFIDKLSLLLKLNDEVDLNSYYEAGYENLFRLKDYNLKIDAMQEANYEEFHSYIKQGNEAELTSESINEENLTLKDYSLGKLLGLLILNTLGLIVAQVMKVFYSLANKFKGLAKQNVDLNGQIEKQKTIDLSNARSIVCNEVDVTLSESKKYEEQAS
ncbi:hypothetical protein ACXR6G_06330 [Ancylomarina sp. YFZ004]